MSGYIGNAGDAAQVIANDNVDNAVHAVLNSMSTTYRTISRKTCKDCQDDIPEGRQIAVPGVQFCVLCQDAHMVIRRVKMLTKML